jgi:hypothetical protein
MESAFDVVLVYFHGKPGSLCCICSGSQAYIFIHNILPWLWNNLMAPKAMNLK